MNIKNIFNAIEQVDPEIYERTSPRRDIIKNWGRKITMTALPLALGSLLNKAYGKVNVDVFDVLNFALTLEYLEYRFYEHAINTSGLIQNGSSGLDVQAITQITADEHAHVNFLMMAIQSAGGTPVGPFTFENFDYTAKGTYNDVFSNYQTFLAVAQAFEDTGIRAYKGQGTNLLGTDTLTSALRIHSVEARHAAMIHLLRGVRPWIPYNHSQIDTKSPDAVYAGDENTIQADIDVAAISSIKIPNTNTFQVATEDFDEPLTKDQVLAIVTPFMA